MDTKENRCCWADENMTSTPLASIVWRFAQVFIAAGVVPGIWLAWTTREGGIQETALRAAQVFLFLYLILPVILFTLGSLVFDQPRARVLTRAFTIRVLVWSGLAGGVAALTAYLVALVALGSLFYGSDAGAVFQELTDAIGWWHYAGLILAMVVSGLLAGLWFGRGRAR